MVTTDRNVDHPPATAHSVCVRRGPGQTHTSTGPDTRESKQYGNKERQKQAESGQDPPNNPPSLTNIEST